MVNHPAVRPYVADADAGYLDFAPVVDLPENTFLTGVYGGFAISGLDAEREIHVFILPEGRGRWGFEAVGEAFRHAAAMGATSLYARVSPALPHLRFYARKAGMRPTGENDGGYDIFKADLTCQ